MNKVEWVNNSKNENKLTIIYSVSKEKERREDKIKIFGKRFVEENKGNCKMIINKKEYKIFDYIKYNQYGINPYTIISYKIY